MLKITKELKRWVIKNTDVEVDASDDEIREKAAECLVSGELSGEDYMRLTKDAEEDDVNIFAKKLDGIADGLEKLVLSMTTKTEEDEDDKEEEEDPPKKTAGTAKTKVQPSRLAKMVATMGGLPTEPEGEKTIDIRVKEAAEQYSTTTSEMRYPMTTKQGAPHRFAGQRVMYHGVPMDSPSEQKRALAGTWAKFQILSVTPKLAGSPDRAWTKMTDHEKELLCYLCEHEWWDDSEDNRSRRVKGYRGGIKALIDDATSGGLEAAPIVFDDQVIEAPLLYGELFPEVNKVPIARGRRIEGVSTGTVTASWGGVDDTAIGLFNTASYVAAFDTTIYRWQGSVRIGLDFLSDTPIDFGAHITRQYGERLLEDLDDVIATGNGTTQPQGIMNATGTTSSAWGGVTSLANYEDLRFSVAKAEHKPGANPAFCGTEVSYQRAKAIPVAAADARRLFAWQNTTQGTYDNYGIMDRPYKINESLANTQIFYALLGRYRMYVRKGLAIRTSTEGDTLIRNNEMLIVAMARYGGQLERGACAAVTTTAPA